MITFFKEVAQRWKEPTPVFFKKIQKISASLAALSILVIGLKANGVQVPEFITHWLNVYSLNPGIIATFLQKKQKENAD